MQGSSRAVIKEKNLSSSALLIHKNEIIFVIKYYSIMPDD